MDLKTFDKTQPVNLQRGTLKNCFSPSFSLGWFFLSQMRRYVSFTILFSCCLQTHRELDGIANSERRRYGALHRTTETVSVDAFILWGRRFRVVFIQGEKTDTSMLFKHYSLDWEIECAQWLVFSVFVWDFM